MTLTEVMVVIVLAGVVTLGLVGFYLSSQATWLDASTQAMVQRDATTLVEGITRETRQAWDASTDPGVLSLRRDPSGLNDRQFYWDTDDSLVKMSIGGVDKGPVVSSTVERFHPMVDDSLPLVHLDIWLRGPSGSVTKIVTAIRMYNADAP